MEKKTLKATHITDVLDYVGAILGWRPRHSIALVLMGGNNLGPVMRIDATDTPLDVTAEVMLSNSSEAVADGALLIGFDTGHTANDDLAAELERRGLPVHEVVTVTGDRYAITDGEAGEWHPGESVIGLWGAMRQTRQDGLPVLPVPAGPDATDTLGERLRLLTGDREAMLGKVRALWAARLDGETLTEGQEATVRAALTLPEPRDRMLADTYGADHTREAMEAVFTGDMAHVDWTRVEAGQDALRDLVTRSRNDEAANMLAMLAHTYWIQGRGTPAAKTAEAAYETDKDNRMALLMTRLTEGPFIPSVAKDPARAWSATKGG